MRYGDTNVRDRRGPIAGEQDRGRVRRNRDGLGRVSQPGRDRRHQRRHVDGIGSCAAKAHQNDGGRPVAFGTREARSDGDRNGFRARRRGDAFPFETRGKSQRRHFDGH